MMKKNNVYILEDRGLLYVSGEDCKEFLQNIVTNNINNVDEKIHVIQLYLLHRENICMTSIY